MMTQNIGLQYTVFGENWDAHNHMNVSKGMQVFWEQSIPDDCEKLIKLNEAETKEFFKFIESSASLQNGLEHWLHTRESSETPYIHCWHPELENPQFQTVIIDSLPFGVDTGATSVTPVTEMLQIGILGHGTSSIIFDEMHHAELMKEIQVEKKKPNMRNDVRKFLNGNKKW